MVSDIQASYWDSDFDVSTDIGLAPPRSTFDRYGFRDACTMPGGAQVERLQSWHPYHRLMDDDQIAYYFVHASWEKVTPNRVRGVIEAVQNEPLTWRSSLDPDDDLDASLLRFSEAILLAHPKQQTEDLRDAVRDLTAMWKRETLGSSLAHRIAEHPAYQRIIGMGPAALPLILEDLAADGGHWFIALHTISGARPVPIEDRGRVRKMRDAWLRWGRDEGIIA